MKNIVLTGFMGAGKSSVGRRLAEKLGMGVVDTDDLIERSAGMKISEIFAKHGELHFRELEKKAVAEVSKLENHVIITGGGVVLKEENMKNLRKNGIIVYLHAMPEVLYERVKNEIHRPLLQVKEPIKKIKELLEFRAPFYADNDFMIDASELTVEEVVEEILKKLG
ncbi:MAG: shikimate kinase [Candidatus Hydrothermarchaeota archaeon]|nr:shikimate kinase [Candidatus Hydrothermarchaeota archaeon]